MEYTKNMLHIIIAAAFGQLGVTMTPCFLNISLLFYNYMYNFYCKPNDPRMLVFC